MATIVGQNSTHETLKGSTADDTLIAGEGENIIYGMGGADIFRSSVRVTGTFYGTRDRIEDFQLGIDKIDISAFGVSSWDQLAWILDDTTAAKTYMDMYYYGAEHIIELSNVAFGSLTASDFIFSNSGAKTEIGTSLGDTLFGSTAADTLNGGAGFDELYGGDGNDTLIGGEDYDQLLGGNGDDTLFGSGDNMFGEDGNDTLIGSGDGNTFTGGGGADVFRFVAGPSGLGDNIIMDFRAGLDKLDVSGLGVSSWEQLKLVLTESLRGGTRFTDVQLKNVKISQLKASDFVFSVAGAKTVVGSDWKDTLFGSSFGDKLNGGRGEDVLLGGDGDDTLAGGYDSNDLYGQGGADIFKMSTRLTDEQSGSHVVSQSEDRIRDFKIGTDKIDVSAFGISNFNQLKLILTTKTGGTFFDAYYGGREHTVFLEGVALGKLTAADFIFDTKGTKKVSGSDVEDTLFGSREADIMNGRKGNDLLAGGAGDDVIIGGRGANDLYGQTGRDTFKASARVYYFSGIDTVHDFKLGVDKIDVSAYGISSFDQLEFLFRTENGTDTYIDALYSSDSNGILLKNVDAGKLTAADFVFDNRTAKKENGTGDDDYLFGTKGIDTLHGRDGADELFGGRGDDRLIGGDGEDALVGQRGNDRLSGQDGNDLLYGGIGADELVGGVGQDIFLFTTLSDSKISSKGRDTIYDFSVIGGDFIHLSKIDANTKLAGDQAFSFIGTSAFHGKAGELRYDKKASDTYVYADVNGDKKADFAIHLDDAVKLSEDYFAL